MSQCACGCGKQTGGGSFRPGHDQHLRIETERRVGGVLALARMIDAAEAFVSGQMSLGDFGERVRSLMPQPHES